MQNKNKKKGIILFSGLTSGATGYSVYAKAFFDHLINLYGNDYYIINTIDPKNQHYISILSDQYNEIYKEFNIIKCLINVGVPNKIDRISKDKVKCPICGNLFFMKEVLDPSNQIIKKRKYEKRTEETTIPHSENEIPQVFIFIKDIILFLIACFILWPLAMLTLPIWGSLWLIGKIFDVDSLVEIGEVCEHILVAGGNENRPPYQKLTLQDHSFYYSTISPNVLSRFKDYSPEFNTI